MQILSFRPDSTGADKIRDNRPVFQTSDFPDFYRTMFMNKRLFLFPVLAFLLFSCSPKYPVQRDTYRFYSPDGRPDYQQLNYWAAHPGKKDPSDSVPAPLETEPADSLVDVFFIHPTTFTKKKFRGQRNAAIDDIDINIKTDYSSILYQASVFNGQCRVFAPRYRQAHLYNFFTKDTVRSKEAFDTAYTDILTAFASYLEHENKGRPFIIAGHSQGALLGKQLLKELIENKPLYKQLVAAYIIGWPVPGHYFTSLPLCRDSLQTGCFCSWRSFRKGFLPAWVKKETDTALVSNPLNWTSEATPVNRRQNLGAVVRFNKIYKQSTGGRIAQGVLWTNHPRFPWSFLLRSKNYHVGDINLFYVNIRENVKQRISAYLRQ